MKTYVTTLGCPKNLVDTEASLALLRRAGCDVTVVAEDADVLVVSACSFLDIAWQETMEEIERLAGIKERLGGKKLVVMGCLPKHRPENLREMLPSVDRFIATGEHARLPELIRGWTHGNGVTTTVTPDRFDGFEDRTPLTYAHTAYVKIAEGCSRRCTFCAIPKIRGKMVSRPVASIVREVNNLRAQGVREVSLLAQDITSYWDGDNRFPDLVDAVADTGIEWIRIYYVHPGSLTLKLARRLFAHANVLRYLECPIQHASDRVLKAMRRPYSLERLRRTFGAIREEYPELRVRSEVIVGFPGETEDDFSALKAFVEEIGFSSLGIFSYSPESNTAAASLAGGVEDYVTAERAAELEDIQRSVALRLHGSELGNTHQVLIDRVSDDTPGAPPEWDFAGRYYGQALEVDGEVLLKGKNLAIGQFVTARITGSDVFDLEGEVV